MSQNNFSFPYPVLTVNGDDVIPSLERENVHVEISVDDNNDYVLLFTLKMCNEDLLNYVKEEKADFVLEIDCQATMYRRCIRNRDNVFEVKLPRKEIAGKVYFQPYIIAKQAFKYSSKAFHEDYGDATFDIEAGDVLAIFNKIRYDFDINYGDLRAYSSIMTIRRATDESIQTIRYISDEDKIVVELPTTMYDKYKEFKGDPNYTSIIHASLVHNALLAVMLQEDWSSGEDDLLWKRTIRYRVEHEEDLRPYRNLTEKDNIVALSHRLLGYPIQRMFETISQNTSQD